MKAEVSLPSGVSEAKVVPEWKDVLLWLLFIGIALGLHSVLLLLLEPWFLSSQFEAKPLPLLVQLVESSEYEQTQPPKEAEGVPLNDYIQEVPSDKLRMLLAKSARSSDTSQKKQTTEPSNTPERPTVASLQTKYVEPSFVEQSTMKDILATLEGQRTEKQKATNPSSSLAELETETSLSILGKDGDLPPDYFLKSSSDQKKAPTKTKQHSLNLKITKDRNATRIASQPVVVESQRQRGGMFFELSNYDWPYESYMGRWAKSLVYHWNNNPPRDYISGKVPAGGDVYVHVKIDSSGMLLSYEVTRVQNATAMMVDSVVFAVLGGSSLPPLPQDFSDDILSVHFLFIYPSY